MKRIFFFLAVLASVLAVNTVNAEMQSEIILFEDGDAQISAGGKGQLDEIIKVAPDNATIMVDGFASAKRIRGGNNLLSEERALAVRDYIIAKAGTKRLTVVARGHGVLGSESETKARQVVVTCVAPEIVKIPEICTVTVTKIVTATTTVEIPRTVVTIMATMTDEATLVVQPVTTTVNIKIEEDKIMIHDSIMPQNREKVVARGDYNQWWHSWKQDYAKKKGDWWFVPLNRVQGDFNFQRGREWVNPENAVCGSGLIIRKRPDGNLCFSK